MIDNNNYTDVLELIEKDDDINTCDLAGGKVNNKIINAFDDIDYNLHFGGCNGCTVIDGEDLDQEVFSIVQSEKEVDKVYINYAVEDDDRTTEIGHDIVDKLMKNNNNVTVKWNGDPAKCIKVEAQEDEFGSL